jgi:hypothetical protein
MLSSGQNDSGLTRSNEPRPLDEDGSGLGGRCAVSDRDQSQAGSRCPAAPGTRGLFAFQNQPRAPSPVASPVIQGVSSQALPIVLLRAEPER